MGYYDIPWDASQSVWFNKLLSLSLPALQGKTVLDVGCGQGYFCGWANYQAACKVVGIDTSQEAVALAKEWFPQCSFFTMDWMSLGAGAYDIILCLSAVNTTDNPQHLLDTLMSRLEPGGVLVLELAMLMGDGKGNALSGDTVEAASGLRFFPTEGALHRLLEKYSFKYMGMSPPLPGDSLPRHVYHIYHSRPLAVLLLDRHYSGKSSVVSALMKPDKRRIQGEVIYSDIADGRLPVSSRLMSFIQFLPGTRHMNPPKITHELCGNGLLPEFIEIIISLSGREDFILEHYIPQDYHAEVFEQLHNAGFFVVDVALYAGHKRPWTVNRVPYSQYLSYVDYLRNISDLDEEAYLQANPDIAKAVAAGIFPSARFHYWYFGKREKRRLTL